MLQKPAFNLAFIQQWEPQFSGIVHSVGEYDNLVQTAGNEISNTGLISEDTLKRIVKWKAARVFKIVRWSKFDSDYAPRLKLTFSSDIIPEHKMYILLWDKSKLATLPVDTKILNDIDLSIADDAYGINVAIASTILHFAYPDDFPIVDIRVMEFLYFIGKIRSTIKTIPHYYTFRSVLLAISRQYGCSLRTIDKAMFAYHLLALQPAINKKFKSISNNTSLNLRLDDNQNIRRFIIDKL